MPHPSDTTSQDLLARAVAQAASAVLVVGLDGCLVWANAAAQQLLGGDGEQLVGQALPLHGLRDAADFLTIAGLSLEPGGAGWLGNLRLRRPDGTSRVVTASAARVTLDPGPDHVVLILRDITEERRLVSRLRRLALRDVLTGLPNRDALAASLRDALRRARRSGDRVAVHVLDIDRFKLINDTYGHPIGDALLKAVGDRLARNTRDTDAVARIGGDEFAVVQNHVHTPDEAAVLARKLLALMGERFELADTTVRTSTSVGVAMFPTDGVEPSQLLRKADLALYQAKHAGRNVYRFYSAELEDAVRKRHTQELALGKGLADHTLMLEERPWTDIAAGQPAGVCLQLAWRQPQMGVMAQAELLAMAEATGLDEPVGRWLIAEACRRLAAGPMAPARIALPLPPRALCPLRIRRFEADLEASLRQAGVAPRRLRLVTDAAAIARYGDAGVQALESLHALGVGLALAGAEGGGLPLARVGTLPIEALHVGGDLVAAATQRREAAAAVEAVMSLGRSLGLGLALAVSGADDEAALTFALTAGCTELLGAVAPPETSAAPGPA